MSVVQVDHPYMNPDLDWLHPVLTTPSQELAARFTVYNYEDVARPLEMNISIIDRAQRKMRIGWWTGRSTKGSRSALQASMTSLCHACDRGSNIYSQTHAFAQSMTVRLQCGPKNSERMAASVLVCFPCNRP